MFTKYFNDYLLLPSIFSKEDYVKSQETIFILYTHVKIFIDFHAGRTIVLQDRHFFVYTIVNNMIM